MIIQELHVLLLIIFLPTLISATTPESNFTRALPNCIDRCGNVTIPYPFGTTGGCSRSDSFLVTCDDSISPPKLFMQNNTKHEVSNISLGGQLRILQPAAIDCHPLIFNKTRDHGDYDFKLPGYLTFNNKANKYTVLGCNTIGYMTVTRINGSNYQTSCTTTCNSKEDLFDDQFCGGLGCCKFSSIAKNVVRVELDIQPSDQNNTEKTWKFSNCSYAVFGEEEATRSLSLGNLTNFNLAQMFPIVVDWAIGNEPCASAKANSSSYACKSTKSYCKDPDNGSGYRCYCNGGYDGNPYLIDGCQDINECVQHPTHCFKNSCQNTEGNFSCVCPKGYHGSGTAEEGCVQNELHIYKVVAVAAIGVIIAILLACLSHLGFKRRRSEKMKHIFFLRNGGTLLEEKLRSARTMSSGMARQISSNNGHVARIFSSIELRKATNNFCNNMIIGKGGFGIVYRGYLYDKKMVAIKKSKEVDPTQIEQFINEVFVLSQISHRNVVKFLGCCLETQAPLLVYEFITNGTLSDHIHHPENKYFLHWDLRLKIVNETADVLSYLHSAASTPIIHRDVKSTNILLDKDFSAKVSDFGASRLVPMDQSRLSTVVLGTAGYLDPEYMQTGQLTEKSDVYSFGIVLVELITGIKAFRNDMPQEEKSLANFFLLKLREKCLIKIIDKSIMCAGNEEQIIGVAKLASVCLNLDGEDRPSMKEVAMELENLRLGRKHSVSRHEYNAEKTLSFGGKRSDSFVNVEGYSAATSHSSMSWGNAKLSGGR